MYNVCATAKSSGLLYMTCCVVYYAHNTCLQVRHSWPISGGLLVERQISADWGYDGLATLFSLLHPMDDFCPVTCKRPAAGTANSISVLILAVMHERE